MKTILLVCACLVALVLRGQETPQELEAWAKAEAARMAAWAPRDPWRELDGATNYAKGNGWKHFMGKVVDVQPGGIMVSGIYDEPGLVEAGADANVAPWDFFVEGFPHTVADDEDLQRDTHFTAFEMGTYTYTTVLGGSRTVRRLIYGKRCAIPADLIEAQQRALADRKEKLAREKADAAANALAWNQKQAEAGDAYGLLRMGERYLHGDGVETNADRARDYLARAAALGNARAKEELAAAGR